VDTLSIGWDMSKFHGFGFCRDCSVACTSGNFLDYQSKRYCIACWVQRRNPEHPEIEELREKVKAAAKEWKCAKWTREEGPLPLGPKAHKN
tara:strand:+ start:3508 stop:3780 length:273 start_codon:yes stop_codon:yes gene_type:complete